MAESAEAEMPMEEAGAAEWASVAEEIVQEELKLDEVPPIGAEGATEVTPPLEAESAGGQIPQEEVGVQPGPTPVEEKPLEELQLDSEAPSLSSEEALEETIKVVEDAIQRNKKTPEKTVQEEPAPALSAQEFVSEEIPREESGFQNQSESWSPISKTETGMPGVGNSNHPVVMWLKDILSEQMGTVIKQAVPEMTRNMIQDEMSRVIEQSVPELTKNLLQERITKIMDDKKLAKMMVEEINQNREFVTNLLTNEAPTIITQVVQKMVPDLAEKIIRDEIEHIKQGSG